MLAWVFARGVVTFTPFLAAGYLEVTMLYQGAVVFFFAGSVCGSATAQGVEAHQDYKQC